MGFSHVIPELMQKMYNLIGSTLTRLVLQADLVAVTISKYEYILKSKYKKKNVMLIPHGAFETPAEPSWPPSSRQIAATCDNLRQVVLQLGRVVGGVNPN